MHTKSRNWRREGRDDTSVTPQTSLTSGVSEEEPLVVFPPPGTLLSPPCKNTDTHRSKRLSHRTYRHVFQTFLTACPILCLANCGTKKKKKRKWISFLKTPIVIYKGAYRQSTWCVHTFCLTRKSTSHFNREGLAENPSRRRWNAACRFVLAVVFETANPPGAFSIETEHSKHRGFRPVILSSADYTGQPLGLPQCIHISVTGRCKQTGLHSCVVCL